MSGNEGIGFGPSFSELFVGKALSTLWASEDTSSLLKNRISTSCIVPLIPNRNPGAYRVYYLFSWLRIQFCFYYSFYTYGSPAANSSRYLEGTWSGANTLLANFMATWRTCTSGCCKIASRQLLLFYSGMNWMHILQLLTYFNNVCSHQSFH